MNRRSFLGWCSVGWLASSFPIALSACVPQTQEQSQSPEPVTTADGEFVAVGTTAQLTQSGQILDKTALGKTPVLVIPDPQTPSAVVAVNPTCSHNGCLVQWEGGDRSTFICPCHNSQFAADGKVLRGPAEQPLAVLAAKVEGDRILVKG